jgi:hypothetical protein
MANPNIVAVNSIYGMTTGISMSTTANTVLLVNATSSGKVFKIESVLAANVTSAATNVVFGINTSATGGGTSFEMAQNISVPSSATLSIIDKNNTFYLLENQSLVGSASASSSIDLVISYEDIS